LTSGDPRKNENFGASVAVSGNDLFVGAPNLGSTGPDYAGAVYEFDATSGQLLHTFRNPTTGLYDWFGYSLTTIGDELLIGSPAKNSAFLYDIPTGDLLYSFTDPGPVSSTGFGYSVASFANGNYLIGAAGSGSNNDIGAAYIFAAVPEPRSLLLLIVSLAIISFLSVRRNRHVRSNRSSSSSSKPESVAVSDHPYRLRKAA
jgi:hypothetical protein